MRRINIYIYILHWVLGLQFVFRWLKFGISKMDTLNPGVIQTATPITSVIQTILTLKPSVICISISTSDLLFPKIFQKRNLDDFSDVYLVKTYFVVKNFLRKQNNGWPHLRCCDVQMLRWKAICYNVMVSLVNLAQGYFSWYLQQMRIRK